MLLRVHPLLNNGSVNRINNRDSVFYLTLLVHSENGIGPRSDPAGMKARSDARMTEKHQCASCSTIPAFVSNRHISREHYSRVRPVS